MSESPVVITSDARADVDMAAGRHEGWVQLSRQDIDQCQCEKCHEQVPIGWIEVVEVDSL
jgi:hypothetical protein